MASHSVIRFSGRYSIQWKSGDCINLLVTRTLLLVLKLFMLFHPGVLYLQAIQLKGLTSFCARQTPF